MPNFAAISAVVLVVTGYARFYDALRQDTLMTSTNQNVSWVHLQECVKDAQGVSSGKFTQNGKTTTSGLPAFFMHIFFMSLAFGLFAPLASVCYAALERTLGLPHGLVKGVHGALNFGAALAGTLGFAEIFMAHTCGGPHFQSVHSWIGGAVLLGYWLQFLSAGLLLTNTRVLAAGSAARRAACDYHRLCGGFLAFGGLVSVATGTLLFTGKKQAFVSLTGHGRSYDEWWAYSNAIMVFVGAAAAIALALSGGKEPSRATSPVAYKSFAVAAVVLAFTFYTNFYHALRSDALFAGSPEAVNFGWVHLQECVKDATTGVSSGKFIQNGKTTTSGLPAFFMHIFFMSLAFGLFAPLASVCYAALERTLGLPHGLVKGVHGALNFGAALAGTLGFAEIFMAHTCGGPHFQSVHSWIGGAVLLGYWLQFLSAGLLLTNTRVLAAGSAARRAACDYHRLCGGFLAFGGLVSVATGTLLFTGKKQAFARGYEAWWAYSNAIMLLLGLAAAMALTMFEGRRNSGGAARSVEAINAVKPLMGADSI